MLFYFDRWWGLWVSIAKIASCSYCSIECRVHALRYNVSGGLVIFDSVFVYLFP